MTESTGCPDIPITAEVEDSFEVQQYVKGLHDFILMCDTPMTISIQGDWGSGKTSMMNMIRSRLGSKVLPIWFNTWQFSQFQLGNSLAISMMEVLVKKLGGKSDTFKNMLNKIAKGLFVGITEAAIGSTVANKAGKLLDNLSNLSCVDEILELKKEFQKAVDEKLATENKKRIVIFIDDLDRLQPSKAVELLEVMKIFLDCEKCVFVLAVDYEVVTLGIAQKYGTDVGIAKGKSFFDKIIQLPFKMPVAQYNIGKYVKTMMKQISLDDVSEVNVSLFSDLIKNSIGFNPRGMKRLFNSYQLLNIITRGKLSTISSSIRQRILFATVCMQMSFDAVYDYLSAGNVNIDTLNSLKAIDDRTIHAFLKQQASFENLQSVAIDEGDGTIDDNILNTIFDDKISIEELSVVLSNLSTFIKYFIQAIHTGSGDELTEEEANNLRYILKHSAITDVNSGNNQGEATQQANKNKEKNINLAQKVNDLLKDKGIGEFKIVPSKSKSVVGGFVFTGKNTKEYDLRYILQSAEKSIVVSIYINGRNQLSQDFYNFMGENPLDYPKNPIMNKPPCWYIYDDVLTVSDNEESATKIAEIVADAYNRLNDYIAEKS